MVYWSVLETVGCLVCCLTRLSHRCLKNCHWSCWRLYLLSHRSPWLTRSQGCSLMCHWCRPHCYQLMVQYQAHCHDPPLTALQAPALEWHRWLGSSGRWELLWEGVLVLVVCYIASTECILSQQQGCH